MPSEAECLRQYEDFSRGGIDDYEKAAEWARRGHELGYLNCTAALCSCYESGSGVPRDFARALELAHEMEAKGFPLGWRTLAGCYLEGHGVPLDRDRARAYAKKLCAALSRPVKGVDEDARRSALIGTYILLNSTCNGVYRHEYQEIARENMLHSTSDDRYGFYASSLLYQMSGEVDDDGDLFCEALGYLEKGVALGDPVSMYMLGTLLLMQGDPQGRAAALLMQAARAGSPAVYADLLRFNLLSDEDAVTFRDSFWFACNRGVSWMRREGALPCHIRLLPPDFACLWKVHAEPGKDVRAFPTRLALHNEGEELLSGLTLRLCSADAGVDANCPLSETIAPGETLELDLAEYEKKAGGLFGKEFYVELRDGAGRHCEMTLDHSDGLPFFYHRVESFQMPLQLWWERGALGSRVLCVTCTEGELCGLRVIRLGKGLVSGPCTLRAGEVKRFGRLQLGLFLKGMAEGEQLALLAEGLPQLALVLD